MWSTIAAWVAIYAIALNKDALCQEQNTTGYETIPTDTSADIEPTTILFSGFFLPSTAPPTTTLIVRPETTVLGETQEQEEEKKEGRSNLFHQYLVNNINKAQRYQPKLTRVELVERQPNDLETTHGNTSATEERVQTKVASMNTPDVSQMNEASADGQRYDLEESRLVEEHPCRRDCSSGQLMTCKYKFKVEWYESLSKACYNCPRNITDCYREDCIPADGFQRPLTVINRRFPGPSIEVCMGDQIEITLENRLMSETTTIHWHGLHQRESPYMDGVPFVSQCPVMPRADFLYRYTAANPGTHFWHSHSGVQRADGMFGALVVRTPSDPYRHLYDEDLSQHTIQLIDWCHGPTIGVFTGHHHARTDNKPPTLLVNGRGVYSGAPPASFTVQQGKRYRFRLINAGVLNCPIQLSIDNHTMVVISTDGSDIAPTEVDSLVSYAGERWDFILKADAPSGNYWMRYKGLMDCDERFTSAFTVSVLHYLGSDDSLPEGPIGYNITNGKGRELNPLNEKESNPSINANELHATIPADRSLKPTPDRTVILSYDFNKINNPHMYKKSVYGFYQVADRRERVLTPQINHISLTLPPFPLLSQYSEIDQSMLCGNQNLTNCSKKYCECLNVIELKLNEVVELILIDIGHAYDANHPFHLHGHAFRVIAMDRIGNVTSVDDVLLQDATGAIRRNLVDPPLKDTVTVPDGGYTIVRFIADNPGYWMFHCHLEFHVELGMAVIFKVGEHSDFPSVPPGFPKCGNYKLPATETGNEVYWTYNSSKTPEGSFTLTEWWPQKNASPQIIPSIVLNSITLLLYLLINNIR